MIRVYAVITKKLREMLVFRKFIGDELNVDIRHCNMRRVLFQKVLSFHNAGIL
jgi:hypothetical protein